MSKKIFAMLLTITLLFSVVSMSFSANALIDTSIKYGDVDGDDDIDIDDCRIALAAAAGIESIKDADSKDRADINNDGEITIFDARQILRDAASLIELEVSGAFQGFDAETSYHVSPEALIYDFNTSLNRIKTEKAGFDKQENITVTTFNIERVGSLGNAASGIIKKIEEELISANEPEEAKTFVKGDNCDNAISAETKTFVSRLTSENILGAKSSYDVETGVIRIEIALADCEIDNVGQTAYNDVFSPSILIEKSESVVENVFDTSKLSDAKRKMLKNGVLVAEIDRATGNVISYTTTYETDVYLSESDFKLTKLYGVQYGTKVTTVYDNFQW